MLRLVQDIAGNHSGELFVRDEAGGQIRSLHSGDVFRRGHTPRNLDLRLLGPVLVPGLHEARRRRGCAVELHALLEVAQHSRKAVRHHHARRPQARRKQPTQPAPGPDLEHLPRVHERRRKLQQFVVEDACSAPHFGPHAFPQGGLLYHQHVPSEGVLSHLERRLLASGERPQTGLQAGCQFGVSCSVRGLQRQSNRARGITLNGLLLVRLRLLHCFG
mmetsp:Transcript_28490/g.54359  ORF Transcript_28490/g.54359 Transcript_28490/m.54359 type:complete len:218 (+) Transcript_28490:598-1251(+)